MRTPDEIAEEMSIFVHGKNSRNPNERRGTYEGCRASVRSRDAEIAKRCQEILDIDIKDAIKIKVAIEVLKEELEEAKK